MLLGALFMATDPVTSPLTPRGNLDICRWHRRAGGTYPRYGGFPEGVMYAILLLMNAATPLIDRYTQPRVFGKDQNP